MKRIGEPAFTFRLPAIVDGGLGSIDPSHLHGQWVALSFVPHLGRFEIDLFDRQGQLMEELGASLLVVSLETQALQREECVRIGSVHFTVLGDPLGRLRRLYGGVTTQSWGGRKHSSSIQKDVCGFPWCIASVSGEWAC